MRWRCEGGRCADAVGEQGGGDASPRRVPSNPALGNFGTGREVDFLIQKGPVWVWLKCRRVLKRRCFRTGRDARWFEFCRNHAHSRAKNATVMGGLNDQVVKERAQWSRSINLTDLPTWFYKFFWPPVRAR
jgi:hypothetical protein